MRTKHHSTGFVVRILRERGVINIRHPIAILDIRLVHESINHTRAPLVPFKSRVVFVAPVYVFQKSWITLARNTPLDLREPGRGCGVGDLGGLEEACEAGRDVGRVRVLLSVAPNFAASFQQILQVRRLHGLPQDKVRHLGPRNKTASLVQTGTLPVRNFYRVQEHARFERLLSVQGWILGWRALGLLDGHTVVAVGWVVHGEESHAVGGCLLLPGIVIHSLCSVRCFFIMFF